ncbi:hypothetical protein [Brevundimonas sp.]|uniref:hypothetical protein n=1 Tax=Brevundimonas sp. TaxID=1871086 RepID=UPI0035683B36
MQARIQAAKVTWLNVRLTLSYIETSRTWIDPDLVSALLVAGVLSASVEAADQQHADLRRFLEPGGLPDDVRRPVNVMSVALSLSVPRETARTKVRSLLDRGVLEHQGRGIILSSTVILSEPLMAAMAEYLRATSTFIDGLATLEACGVVRADRTTAPPWSIGWVATRSATTHILRGIDYARALNPSISLTTRFVLLTLAPDGSRTEAIARHAAIRGTPCRSPPDLGARWPC